MRTLRHLSESGHEETENFGAVPPARLTPPSPSAPAAERFLETGCTALAFEGPSGSAKTRLIAALVSWFAAQGLRVAVVHDSPDLDLGDQGKDTWKFRQAGANPVALAAPGLCQITYAIPEDTDFPLFQVLTALTPHADLILVQGLDHSLLPRVVMIEPGASPTWRDNSEAIALISPEPVEAAIPVFQPHQIPELSRHILSRLKYGNNSKNTRIKD
jgi:molybdopterin-guanine dinucleotide biosynthesis protein B